ncbi:MAG: hypothetical protein QF578_03645 [Alphaproteobacteria bacterium]|nr:hypothetical protein [Alphaproteobacteria bacterium]MDP6563895.1 hypothetical protein [Alphaproteobacteria bacterium]MDP6812381.1 hypothetical protein [Alphaproteobacteria bacterium]
MDSPPSPTFSQEIQSLAHEMLAKHGAEVENATTEKMIEVLDTGSLDEVLYWLKVRQCIRASGTDRHTRRLPDKLAWAVEQALEQGRSQLAKLIGGVYREVKAEDDRLRAERKR